MTIKQVRPVVLVTGGSGDIGAAIGRAFARAGFDVAVTYADNVERASALVDELRTLGSSAHALRLDQRDPAQVERAATEVVERFDRCDVLVNNAGWNIGIPFTDLDQLDAAIWDQVLETNLRGPYLLTRALAPALAADGGGHVVNVASTGGLVPASSSIAYSCSKAGLIHLTHCLAVALGPAVAVNAVAPGLVEGSRLAQRVPEDLRRVARDSVVLQRVPSASDIAEATVFLARGQATTGQTLVVDGGLPHAMNFG